MPVRFSAKSDRGKIRPENEDYMGGFPEESLFIVADGMGGHKAGEVASQLAVETIYQALRLKKQNPDSPFEQNSHYLDDSIQKANRKIFEEGGKNPEKTGMGTTVVAAWIHNSYASIGYVGDSRAYLLRKQNLRQVTSDHSLVNDYLQKGLIQQSEADQHPHKHVLSRAVGTQETVEADIINLPLQADDLLLLCTDGLTNMLSKDDIEAILNGPEDIEKKSRALIDRANHYGGTDNITVVLIQFI
jgi:serine/threonine protein phosphatase PrpC